MAFIRVRQATGPAHEFDIAEAAYARDKDAYEVIDKEPVDSPRPAKYQKGRRPLNVKRSSAPKGKKAPSRRATPKTKTSSVKATEPAAVPAETMTAAEPVEKEESSYGTYA